MPRNDNKRTLSGGSPNSTTTQPPTNKICNQLRCWDCAEIILDKGNLLSCSSYKRPAHQHCLNNMSNSVFKHYKTSGAERFCNIC